MISFMPPPKERTARMFAPPMLTEKRPRTLACATGSVKVKVTATALAVALTNPRLVVA